MGNSPQYTATRKLTSFELWFEEYHRKVEQRRKLHLTFTVGDRVLVGKDAGHPETETFFGNRDLGGREVTVVGFAVRALSRSEARVARMKAGFYLDREHAYVNDRGSVRLVRTDLLRFPEEVHEARLAQREAPASERPPESADPQPDFVAELPDTGIWDGDLVTLMPYAHLDQPQKVARGTFPEHPEAFMATNARYKLHDGAVDHLGAEPKFSLTSHLSRVREGSYAAFSLTLIARGNLWREAHGEPLVFHDLAEEALFFLHEATIIRWIPLMSTDILGHAATLKQALDSLREHGGHAVRYYSEFTGTGTCDAYAVYQFSSTDLGQRLRQATLEHHFRLPGDDRPTH